jgi:CheY-like chemotaxis protein
MPTSISLLIAHPQELIRAGLRAMLDKSGIKTIGEANDAPSTLTLAKKHKPDVVLLDAAIPGGDAFELVTKLTKSLPPLPLGGVVVAGQLTATMRAVPPATLGMLDLDVNLGCLDIEPHVRHFPRSGQAENLLVEIRVEHVPCRRGKNAFSPTELPTKIPDGPRF